MNITLIGMSGAGKSHVGRELAEKLTLQFFDIDDAMEARYKKPLQQILNELGEDAFIKEEEALVLSMAHTESLVISPGGSVIYSDSAMNHLKRFSTILFLDIPCAVIEARIDVTSRGIVGLKNKTFAELFEERRPRYLKWADHRVTSEISIKEMIALSKVKNRS